MSLKKFALVAALSAFAAPAFAAECSTILEANDAMQYNKKVIEISKSCKDFTVELKHVGKMPKAAMGHNFVLVKKADTKGVALDGGKAGPAKDYIPEGDARVIAHTKMIGGGESDKVTFEVSKLDPATEYQYFCTFPGHQAIMIGDIKFVD